MKKINLHWEWQHMLEDEIGKIHDGPEPLQFQYESACLHHFGLEDMTESTHWLNHQDRVLQVNDIMAKIKKKKLKIFPTTSLRMRIGIKSECYLLQSQQLAMASNLADLFATVKRNINEILDLELILVFRRINFVICLMIYGLVVSISL